MKTGYYIKTLLSLIAFLITSGLAIANDTPTKEVVRKAASQLKAVIEQNAKNDREGLSYRNTYVIEVELSKDWVEERGQGKKVLQSKYESIKQALQQFNNARKDKLRAYVVVVNDWELQLKEHVDVNLLPGLADFDQIAKQTELNAQQQKEGIETEMRKVPAGIVNALHNDGYTDMAVYFGASIKFYTMQESKPVQREYKYTSLSLAGTKLPAVKNQIRSKISGVIPGITLENQLEQGVLALIEAIKEVVDQQVPFALAYKVTNPSIQNWAQTGDKTQVPFSGVTNDQQVYDYTGVFATLKDQIINKLPDPTAKVIITDNLTSESIIKNIKEQVAKALTSNVFWFHLDRKGELHTEFFYAETVKRDMAQKPGTIGLDAQDYIGKLYNEAGPKLKSPADLIDFLNIEAHVFRALNNLLKSAKIPRDWWDTDHPDYLLGTWGKYLSPKTGFTFAYLCGVWNGVIDNLSLVSGLLSLKGELQGAFFKMLFDDQYRTQLFADVQFYYDNLGLLVGLGYEMVKTEISNKVSQEWEKLSKGNYSGGFYVAGLATVEVVIAVFTAGAVEAVKASLMTIKLIRIPVEFIKVVGTAMLKPVAMVIKAGGKIVMEAGEYVIVRVVNGVERKIARLTAQSKLIIYEMLGAAENTIDEIPIPQTVVLTDGNGNVLTDVVLAKTATGWGFKKRSEFLEMLSKALAKYPSLRDEVLLLKREFQQKFIDDFLKATDDDLLGKLNTDPSLIEGWRRLSGSGSPLRMQIKYMAFIKQLPSTYKYLAEGDVVKVFSSSGDELAELSNDMIKAKGGAEGSWNQILNQPTIPNHKYLVDNYLYETDNFGRVKKVSGRLSDVERGRNTNQQGLAVSLKDGIKGRDDGGHLIANILYGPGEQLNYLPMNSSLNRGAWRVMEENWADLIKQGKEVRITIEPIFDGASKRPVRFKVVQDINGEEQIFNYVNEVI